MGPDRSTVGQEARLSTASQRKREGGLVKRIEQCQQDRSQLVARLRPVRAVVMDIDGVVTDTVRLHAAYVRHLPA
jgi:hypothetical protein